MTESGQIYYADFIGWHIVLIESEFSEGKLWWHTFIMEEGRYNWYTEDDFWPDNHYFVRVA